MTSFWQKVTGHKPGPPARPPTLTSPLGFPYRPFQFKSEIEKGYTYEIQATTNLRQWTTLATEKSRGEIEFVDAEAARYSNRFYRIVIDGVYSTNALGFATASLPPGYSLIANPLSAPDNSIAALFKDLPEGITVSRFDQKNSSLVESLFEDGEWSNPGQNLMPGEGAVFFNPTAEYILMLFVGEVVSGDSFSTIPEGFSIRSSCMPQPGSLHFDLGFPVAEGDVIHIFDRDKQKYTLYPYTNAAAWSANPPMINVAEAFWVEKKTAGKWAYEFSVEKGWIRAADAPPPAKEKKKKDKVAPTPISPAPSSLPTPINKNPIP